MWQHRQDPADEIHGGGAALCFRVGDGPQLQEVTDVCDVNPDLNLVLAGEVLYMDGVIQILGRSGINGEDPLRAEVVPVGRLLLKVSLGRLHNFVDLIQLLFTEIDVMVGQLVGDERMSLLSLQTPCTAQASTLQAAKRMLAALIPDLNLNWPQLETIQLAGQLQSLARRVVDLEQNGREPLVGRNGSDKAILLGHFTCRILLVWMQSANDDPPLALLLSDGNDLGHLNLIILRLGGAGRTAG
mmetsp:Transcript_43066/g.100324  ORF Transcript_43066/g.100324 Transcript_43066/m.100324 type:complete len:243 (+) Transcript_43066:1768-2496(+)